MHFFIDACALAKTRPPRALRASPKDRQKSVFVRKPDAFLATLFTCRLNYIAIILQKKKFFYFYAIEKPAPAGMARSLAAAGEKEGIWRKAIRVRSGWQKKLCRASDLNVSMN